MGGTLQLPALGVGWEEYYKEHFRALSAVLLGQNPLSGADSLGTFSGPPPKARPRCSLTQGDRVSSGVELLAKEGPPDESRDWSCLANVTISVKAVTLPLGIWADSGLEY